MKTDLTSWMRRFAAIAGLALLAGWSVAQDAAPPVTPKQRPDAEPAPSAPAAGANLSHGRPSGLGHEPTSAHPRPFVRNFGPPRRLFRWTYPASSRRQRNGDRRDYASRG